VLSYTYKSQQESLQGEIYVHTEGEPSIIRRAKVFEKTCDEKTINIDENPFVGTLGKSPLAVYPLLEVSCGWVRRQLSENLNVGLGTVTSENLNEEDNLKLKWLKT
jgi:hypothetical protein